MIKVNVHQAKTQLSRLLARVSAGEEVVIAKSGKPIARLVPWDQNKKNRVAGKDRDLLQVPVDFDEPLPPQILEGFES